MFANYLIISYNNTRQRITNSCFSCIRNILMKYSLLKQVDIETLTDQAVRDLKNLRKSIRIFQQEEFFKQEN